MENVNTNRVVFELIRDSNIRFSDYNIVVEKILDIISVELSPLLLQTLRRKIRSFCYNLQVRWRESGRGTNNFLIKNKLWLDNKCIFLYKIKNYYSRASKPPSGTTPSNSFEMLSDRQKRRRTETMCSEPKEYVNYVAHKNISDPDSQYCFHFIINHPENAKRLRQYIEETFVSKPAYSMSQEKALGVFVSARLTRGQYNLIRDSLIEHKCEIFPSYYQIQKAKSEVYPSKDAILI